MHFKTLSKYCLKPLINCLMKFITFLIIILISSINVLAQLPSNTTEQQLEAATESNDDIVPDDDSFLQQMQFFSTNPVNLNTADATELKELSILSPMQLQNLLSYRNLFGNFIDIYELQAVPGWNIRTIQRLRPYVSVAIKIQIFNSISDRLKDGQHTILFRSSKVLETAKGYALNASTATNFYPGSSQKLFMRYKYQYKNLLQYGISGDKDAGEQFFKGPQKQGFDFYSAHIFVRNLGILKSLAIGDFTVNMGQGLTQWQSLAFKKSSDVVNVKRQLAVLRPYNSSGEINFHRGIGITLAKKNMELTLFASYKKVDGNFIEASIDEEEHISSLQTSGLHRTKSELNNKGTQQQLAFGGNIAYNKNNFHLGINAIKYHFKLPIIKPDNPYNLYALNGKNLGNYSIDYSYTFKNLHFFGEAAISNSLHKAFVNGLILSVDSRVDMSMVYRNISSKYQSLYTNAFTETPMPINEKGLYTGISIRPDDFWRIDAYADFYKFPWLKYLVSQPSVGADYMVQLSYKPNKELDMYIRYRTENKARNYNPDELALTPVIGKPKQNIRTQINYKLNTVLTLRNRVEMVWFDKKQLDAQQGFSFYTDLLYKPLRKKYSGNFRLQYFETDGYDSRLYAYENDVLFSYSIPVLYGKGFRYYINFNYDVNKKLSLWFRWAQTIYQNQTVVGTGLDEIKGNRKSELKLQLQIQIN